MNYSVRFRRLASAEFDDAADWYEQRRAGRGVAFTRAVRQVVAIIADNPEAYPEVRDGVREAGVPGYPYAVYFRIEPDFVDIVAVFHTSRDPADWQGRT